MNISLKKEDNNVIQEWSYDITQFPHKGFINFYLNEEEKTEVGDTYFWIFRQRTRRTPQLNSNGFEAKICQERCLLTDVFIEELRSHIVSMMGFHMQYILFCYSFRNYNIEYSCNLYFTNKKIKIEKIRIFLSFNLWGAYIFW